MIEEELAIGRRAFPKTQELLAGGVSRRLPGLIDVCWHGSARHPETGAFALVNVGGALVDLVGDVVKVTAPSGMSVYVFVLTTRDVTCPLSLTRRAFLGLAQLAQAPLACTVEVI